MIDKLGLSGEVQVSIRKGKKQKIKNSIDTALRYQIASSLQAGKDFFIGGSNFGTDNFATPTSAENGIVVHTSTPTYYETKTTSATASISANTVVVVSSTRADGSSYAFTGAKLGHDYSSNGFNIGYATTTFSQAVADGQQLDLTWTITLS
jgi:hypothetical protein